VVWGSFELETRKIIYEKPDLILVGFQIGIVGN
jgi:hypothetical protein